MQFDPIYFEDYDPDEWIDEDYFYEDGSLKGVFTLSKENKDVKIKISQKENELKEIRLALEQKREEKLQKSLKN